MTLDFLSGLLLITVVLAIVLFVVKELIGDRHTEHGQARNLLANAFERLSGGEAKPVNEHLIGTVGKVILRSGDSARPMRVRLGLESWPARLDSTEEDALPVGAAVKVVGVDGAVLVVVATSDLAGVLNGG